MLPLGSRHNTVISLRLALGLALGMRMPIKTVHVTFDVQISWSKVEFTCKLDFYSRNQGAPCHEELRLIS